MADDPYASFNDAPAADPYAQFADHPGTSTATTTAPAQTPYSFSDYLKSLGSAAVRPVIKAVTALPAMAADTGVAVRNLSYNLSHGIMPTLADFNPFAKTGGSHQEYELPSQSFNRVLDQYTQAPTGFLGKGSELVSSMLLGSQIPAPQGMGTLKGATDSVLKGNAEAIDTVPANFVPAQQALRNQTLERAQQDGYVVPPASNNPTFANRLLEGISGKLKLQQEAAMRNQSVTDMLASRALGQNPDMPLTQGALSAIRSEASQAGYAPIRAVGDIPTDEKFLSDLKGLNEAADGASKSFPGIQSESPIKDVVNSLSQPKFDASDGLDAMKLLRAQADDAFRSGNGTLGTQYKAAAKAIEDQIERHLSSQSESAGLLDTFRKARQQIAQTYTAGKAIVGDTGSSNALKYAGELARNKPLVGDQRTIASFASQFRKAAAFQTESMPSISPLDAYGSAIAASASGSPAPLLLPLTRVGIREYLLSPAGQARALPQAFKAPETLGGLGSLATLSNQVTDYLSQ